MSGGGLGPEYRKLWTASAISNLGDGVMFVAAPLLAATLTRDPALVAGLSLAYTLPRIFLALVSGALVDRLDRRRLMGTVNLFRAALLLVLGLAVAGGWVNLPLLYAVFLLLGVCESLFDNASRSILPAVVPRARLGTANGRLVAAQLVADEFVGPPLGGLLFATAAALPFFLNIGTFAAAAVFILALRGRFRTERGAGAAESALTAEIRDGVRWLYRHRLLRALAGMLGVASVAYMAAFSILVLFARDTLGLDEVGYGLLLAVSALGGLAGSFVAGPFSRRLGAGRTIFVSLLLGATAYLGIALSDNTFFVGAMLALYIFHTVVWNVITVSLRQALVPEGMLGRVNGAYGLLGLIGLAAGALMGGLLSRSFGLTAPFWIGAALLAATAGLALPIVNNETIADARRRAEKDRS